MGHYFLENIDDEELKNIVFENAEFIANLGSWLINIQTKEIILSANYYRIFGMAPGTVIPGTKNFRDGIHPGDYEEVLRTEANALDGNVAEIEYRILYDGGIRYIRQISNLAKNSHGNMTVTGTIQDITRQKIADQKLKETTTFIDHVADATPDVIFIMNIDTKKLVYANRQLSLMLGYSEEQTGKMSSSIFDIMYEDDIPRMMKHIEDMRSAADSEVRTIEYRMKDASGKLRWFIDRNSVFSRDADGIPVEKIGICHEISEGVQQQEELVKSLNILKQAEAITLIGSWQYDVKSARFEWSEGMYRIFELDSTMEVTPDVYIIYALDEDKDKAKRIAKAIKTGDGSFEENLRIIVNDEIKTLKIRSVVLKSTAGKAKEVVGVDLDITDLVKNELSLRELNTTLEKKNKELEKLNSELTQFFYVTGHDLKEPLRKVYTFLEMILNKEAPNLTDAGKSYFRRAQGAIQRLNLMTDDIVSFSQVNSAQHTLADVNLNHIVRHVLDTLKEGIAASRITVQYNELPVVKGYRILLSLLFLHLIDNSIKFRNAHNPNLHIRWKMVKGRDIHITDADNDANYIAIAFSDDGIGFDQKNAESIFRLFHRLNPEGKYKGSGIGLAICQKVMDAHNGFITAASQAGHGATFTCYLPGRPQQNSK